MGALKQICKCCGHKGVIQKSDQQTPEYSRLYVVCRNPQCGHHWVMDLTYSHTTRESKLTNEGLFNYLLNNLPPQRLAEIKSAILQAEQNQLSFAI